MRLYAAACSALQGPGVRLVCILDLLVLISGALWAAKQVPLLFGADDNLTVYKQATSTWPYCTHLKTRM